MRLYHSPSSIELGRECQRKWALRYLDHVRDPEPNWLDFAEAFPKLPPCDHDPRLRHVYTGQCRRCSKLRSAALGKALHANGEATYLGEPLPFATGFVFDVWSHGCHLLPYREECVEVHVEQAIGAEAIEDEHHDTAMRVGPIAVVGYQDAVTWAHAPAAVAKRIAFDLPWPGSVPLLLDYKTSKNIKEYAKTPSVLRRDLACNAYSLDLMRTYGHSQQPCRWLYFQTHPEKRLSVPVDVIIERQQAEDIVGAAAEFAARELDPLERTEDAPYNLESCDEYGCCLMHESVGGPCKAKRSIGARVMKTTRTKRAVRKGETMGMTAEQKARWAKNHAPDAAEATAPAETAATTDTAATETAAVAAATEPPGRRRKRKAPAAAATASAEAPAAEAPGPVDALSAIKQLVAERDEAEQLVADINGRLSELRDALSAALGEVEVDVDEAEAE